MGISQLTNRTIVITGASSGAGRAAAIEFAKAGASIVLASRNEEALSEVAAACQAIGAETMVVVADVADGDIVQQLADTAAGWKGSIYAWVNNAGVLAAGAFDQIPMEVNRQVVTTNLIGYMNGVHAVLPIFKAQGYGVIINNISIGGYLPVPYGACYSASKFGLRGFSEAVREELKEWPNIHMCDLFPGFLSTPGILHAANFTGKKLHPGPVVSNPQVLARKMVRTAIRPRKKSYIGIETGLLKTSHALVPETLNGVTGSVMRKYFSNAKDVPPTEGNVIATTHLHMQVAGDYEPISIKKILGPIAKVAATSLVGLLIGFWAARQAQR